MLLYDIPDFSDVDEEIKVYVAEEARDIMLQVFRGVVANSPVLRGHFRYSWRFAVGQPDLTFVREGGTEKNPLGPPPTPKVPVDTSFPPMFVTNNIPYAQIIEDGTYDSAPAGVLDVTLQDLRL
jgi:hypothetical protein